MARKNPRPTRLGLLKWGKVHYTDWKTGKPKKTPRHYRKRTPRYWSDYFWAADVPKELVYGPSNKDGMPMVFMVDSFGVVTWLTPDGEQRYFQAADATTGRNWAEQQVLAQMQKQGIKSVKAPPFVDRVKRNPHRPDICWGCGCSDCDGYMCGWQDCRTCGAQPGDPCITRSGQPTRKPHARRLQESPIDLQTDTVVPGPDGEMIVLQHDNIVWGNPKRNPARSLSKQQNELLRDAVLAVVSSYEGSPINRYDLDRNVRDYLMETGVIGRVFWGKGSNKGMPRYPGQNITWLKGGERRGVPFLPTQVTQVLRDLHKEGLISRSK